MRPGRGVHPRVGERQQEDLRLQLPRHQGGPAAGGQGAAHGRRRRAPEGFREAPVRRPLILVRAEPPSFLHSRGHPAPCSAVAPCRLRSRNLVTIHQGFQRIGLRLPAFDYAKDAATRCRSFVRSDIDPNLTHEKRRGRSASPRERVQAALVPRLQAKKSHIGSNTERRGGGPKGLGRNTNMGARGGFTA